MVADVSFDNKGLPRTLFRKKKGPEMIEVVSFEKKTHKSKIFISRNLDPL